MKDSNLIKLCLTISILGLIFLAIYAENAETPRIRLNEVENYLGKTVITNGIVERVSVTPTVSFITLRDGSFRTAIVAFDPISNIRRDDNITITGQVKLYKNELEIVAEKIEKLN
jgi:RecJ-like exonuclease